MHRRALLGTFATASVARLIVPHAAAAQAAPKAPNVVLLHGLFADGSCWSDVIRRLQAAGINATSVQNPLTTLEESVAAAQRVLALQDGPTVLVGHSFSGMIVTEAGGDPKYLRWFMWQRGLRMLARNTVRLRSGSRHRRHRRVSSGPATGAASARQLSCGTSPATFRQNRRVCCTPSRRRSIASCSWPGTFISLALTVALTSSRMASFFLNTPLQRAL